MVGEEVRRRTESFCEESPQTFTADLAPVTVEPRNQSLRVLLPRNFYCADNSKPVTNGRHLSKRDTCLNHSKRPRIHSEKHHPLLTGTIPPQVKLVGGPRILQRIVDVGAWSREAQP